MLCVFPHYSGDVDSLIRLLHWIGELGGCPKHDALLVSDAATPYESAKVALELAQKSFRSARLITNDLSVVGWPQGPNSLFATAAKSADQPWFWCETDAVPLKPGWLEAIEDTYSKCGKSFMGAIVPRGTSADTLPENHLNGNAVYPANAWSIMRPAIVEHRAFDISTAEIVVPMACNTSLIQHFYGRRDLAPTFAATRGPGAPENTFTLANIKPEAVFFHRNPDSNLIRLLRDKLYWSQDRSGQLLVVIPYCNKDAALAAKNLGWMMELHGKVEFDCLLARDGTVEKKWTSSVYGAALGVFRTVHCLTYDRSPVDQWPQAANWAFIHVSQHIAEKHKRPWLWCEPDSTALTADWLPRLQSEYDRHHRPFMGVIVMGMGHMNGVGIYPPDVPTRCPRTMASWDSGAFDTTMMPEMIRDCKDASHLIAHVWGMHQGRPHPSRGSPIVFRSLEDLRWVPPGAVLFHREKQGSLVDMLRAAKQTMDPRYSGNLLAAAAAAGIRPR